MFDLFSVKVKQTGVYVHITGVPYNLLAFDIGKLYNTSLIEKYMVRRESWNTIKVHNFFLVELKEILKELLQLRNLRSRRRDLNELKELLETETWLKDTVNPSGATFDFKKLNRFNTIPFGAQREFLESYPLIQKSYHLKGLLLDSAPGTGKAMPLDTRVKVPGGWKRLGDLAVGEPVIGPTGNITRITGIHPQGVTECYKFHFEDGRTASSHPLHLWQVYEDRNTESYTTTTQDIVNHFNEFRYAIPMVDNISGTENQIDGNQVNDLAQWLLTIQGSVDNSITELNYNDRFAIAQAMLEYSGYRMGEREIKFLSDEHFAAENFQQLVWSIGGFGELVEENGTWVVNTRHRDLKNPVNLLSDAQQLKVKTLKIVGITKEKPIETLCISIDSHDKLYIVDDWIVTHNTFTSMVWSELLNDHKTIVVCPLNLVDEVWQKELKKHYKVPPRIWTSKSGRILTQDYDWYIVHYEYVQREGFPILQKFLEGLIRDTKKPPKLIVDESHNFNELKAKQTQRLIELADAGCFCDALPMSGTAIKALGSEAFPIVCLIDKHFDKTARQFFLASYGRNRPQLLKLLNNRIGRGKFTIPELQGLGEAPPFEIIKVKVPGAEKYTLDAIKLRMQTYINDRLAFYHKHLPEMIRFYNETVSFYEHSIRNQPQDLEQLKRYKAIVTRFRTQGYNNFTDSADSVFCKNVEEQIEKGLKGKNLSEFRNVKSAVKYLGLKLRGEALGNVLGRARIEAITDMIEYAGLPEMIDNVEKKTVIFTSYIDALKLAEDYLFRKGYQPVTVYGGNSHDRDRVVRLFETDPKINPLAAVYDSLKEGYPLIMANQIISLNAPYREYEIKQVKARIWRTGQDSPCFFKMLDLDTGEKLNITTRTLDILEWSKEQVDALVSKMEGHAILNNISGQEMLDIGDEPITRPMKVRRSALAVF